jgi:thiol-disulfide isomerase/thioredoxin
MKKISIGITLLFSCIALFVQAQTQNQSFTLKGQISNCADKSLNLIFQDTYGHPLIDTLHLDNHGNFYYQTAKINKPQRVEIRGNKTSIKSLFAAPGYDLTLTGNGKDRKTLSESKRITGKGSESNQYYILLDSIQFARKEEKSWLDLNGKDLLFYATKLRRLKDSVASATFKRPSKQDQYLSYFGSMVAMDNNFYQLYMLATHVYWNNYDYDKSISYIRDNFDHKILKNLYKDQYLISYDYREWLIANAWLDYVVHLDYKKDSTLQKVKDYKLKKVSETYKGRAKEFALFVLLKNDIKLSNSFEQINDYKPIFETYLSKLKNKHYSTSLQAKYTGKLEELLRVQIGKPAPLFTLQNNQDSTYSLEAFKGKVVYIDLWASWCVPCREETPSLKTLYSKYKDDQRIAFISIAVLDEKRKWEKALAEDRPTWLQLFDKEGNVAKSYAANTIPRFVLIDKQGKIVDFNAPGQVAEKNLKVYWTGK